METKYAFIITGDRYALDILQAHAELTRKYDDKTLYNITEVTYMVGMNDSRYFAKCFKNTYGVTPTEYRRASMEGGQN